MLGIVGAGKGTQAKKIAQYLNIPHISTGDIFRDTAKSGTELGLKVKKIMNEGRLIADELVVEIVKERINKQDAFNGYILDGFPRTLNQAHEFGKIANVDTVFYLTLSPEEAAMRLSGRRMCIDCKSQYNIHMDKSFSQRCPECGGLLQFREDDNYETVKIRIKNYIRETKPLIDYYLKEKILKKIDGSRSIDDIFEDITQELILMGAKR